MKMQYSSVAIVTGKRSSFVFVPIYPLGPEVVVSRPSLVTVRARYGLPSVRSALRPSHAVPRASAQGLFVRKVGRMLLLRVPTLGLVTRGNAKLGNASDEASFPREEDYYGVKPDDWPSRVEPEDWRIVAAL